MFFSSPATLTNRDETGERKKDAEPGQSKLKGAQKLQHEILAFDKKTEKLVFGIEIPAGQFTTLAELMAWREPEDAIYEYDLSPVQVSRLESMTGRTFSNPDFIFQLSCSA